MTEYLGREERRIASALIAALPDRVARTLTWAGVDLASSAEQILYVALRQPTLVAATGALSWARPYARLAREGVSRARERSGSGPRADVAVFVTQPVHATLFAPVVSYLPTDLITRVVDARTHGRPSDRIARSDERLVDHLDARMLPSLAAHALSVQRALGSVPAAWGNLLGDGESEALHAILRRGLPLVALDAARVITYIRRARPDVIACFSESGQLARVVPAAAAAARLGTRVVDLPHAEAADPWGTIGAGYDAVAVYGPRAALAMGRAEIPPDRITEIGPLRYDDLLSLPGVEPTQDPRRIVLASQPGDPAKPAFHPDVKRTVLRAALAATASLAPAELVIVPHPTENDTVTQDFLAGIEMPDRVQVRLERPLTLHDVLPGAWILITGASQSVFDAVLVGVPAITVNATGGDDPVTFARDGIALGATSIDEAISLAHRLRDPQRRRTAAAAARAAIGDRLGPLDGGAAARAAAWLMRFVDGRAVRIPLRDEGQLESGGNEHS